MMASPYPAPDWVHFSNLRRMSLSPAHYQSSLTDEQRSRPMLLGALTHAIVLGRGDFRVFTDGEHRRGKAWDKFKEDNADCDLLVLQSEVDDANAIANKILNDPTAGPYLHGNREKDYQWKLFNGRKAAGRIDVVGMHEGRRFLTELKMSTLAKPTWFQWHAAKMNYLAQCAWYEEGLEYVGERVDDVMIVVCEFKKPFAVTTMKLTDRALEQGRKTVHLWSERLWICESANQWPEYAQGVVSLDYFDEFDTGGPDEEEDEAA